MHRFGSGNQVCLSLLGRPQAEYEEAVPASLDARVSEHVHCKGGGGGRQRGGCGVVSAALEKVKP